MLISRHKEINRWREIFLIECCRLFGDWVYFVRFVNIDFPIHTHTVIQNSSSLFYFIFFGEEDWPELTSVANLPLFFFSPMPHYIVVHSSCKSFWFSCVECCHSMA